MSEVIRTFNQIVLLACIVVASLLADAAVEKPGEVLKFDTWKKLQTMQAQNHVVRLTNEILLKKNTQTEAGTDTSWGTESNELESLNDKLKQAKEDLQVAQELEFEDYLAVYLTQFGSDEKMLRKVADKLTPEQVTKTLIYLQRYRSEGQAKAPKATTKQ